MQTEITQITSLVSSASAHEWALMLLSTWVASGATAVLGLVSGYVFGTKSTRRARSYLERGKNFYKERHFASAEEELKRAVEVLENTRAHKLLCQAYIALGDTYRELGNLEPAAKCYILYDGLDTAAHDLACLRLGDIYDRMERLPDALAKLEEARREYEPAAAQNLQKKILLAETYRRIANVEDKLGQLETSSDQYLHSIALLREIDPVSAAGIQTELAHVFMRRNMPRHAVQQFQEAVNFYERSGNLHLAEVLRHEMQKAAAQN